MELAPNLADSTRLFRGTFSPDGKTLYYFLKTTPGTEDYRIYTARREDRGWSAPSRLDLGGEFSDLYPVISPDGRRLVFVSYRPAPGDSSGTPNGYLWYADREGDRWGTPVFIGAANQLGNYHSGPSIAADYSIEYHRLSADYRTRWSLRSKWNGRAYESPTPAREDELSKRYSAWQGGKYLVWGVLFPKPDIALLQLAEKDERGRPKDSELWVSRFINGDWIEPVRAGGKVNTPSREGFFHPTPDGCSILFVRDYSRFYLVGLNALLGQGG